MFNRDISRRLVRLEADRHGDGVRYVVSDRLPTDEEWDVSNGGANPLVQHTPELSPIMTERAWLKAYS